jgi:hypothetical protein
LDSSGSIAGMAQRTPLRSQWRQFIVRHGDHILLGLLILLMILSNTACIKQDTRPMLTGDAHLFLLKTFEFVDTIERQGTA